MAYQIPPRRSTLTPPPDQMPTQILKPDQYHDRHGRPAVNPMPVFYVLAVLLPIIGVILAVRRFYLQDISNGLGLLVTSVVAWAFAFWIYVMLAA